MTVEEILNRIDNLCKERDWSYYVLAKESNLPLSSIYNMFRRNTIPKFDTLEKICEGFQITLADFFSDEKYTRNLTEEDKEILEQFHRLPQVERKILMAYAQGLEKSKGNK